MSCGAVPRKRRGGVANKHTAAALTPHIPARQLIWLMLPSGIVVRLRATAWSLHVLHRIDQHRLRSTMTTFGATGERLGEATLPNDPATFRHYFAQFPGRGFMN